MSTKRGEAPWADLDHITPFDHDHDPATEPPGTPGQTRATNLQPLCRAHHLAKTHHGWTPVRDPTTGITTWTAPTGHVYARPPTAVDPTDRPETTSPATAGASATAPRQHPTGRVSNDITSLSGDVRARLGDHPPVIGGPAIGTPTDEPPTHDLARRFPLEPPF
ncbi:hypothetical protein GCM10027063_36300 [Promicromonospora xylanilytica]